MWLTPLCPAGHLPLKGGDRSGGIRAPSFNKAALDDLLRPSIVPRLSIAERDPLIDHEVPISPLEGEMSRSDRGEYRSSILADRDVHLIRLLAHWPALRTGSGRSLFETIHRIVSASPTISHLRKRGEEHLPHAISPLEGDMPGRAEGGTPSSVAAHGVYA